jgi:hypothetical protein
MILEIFDEVELDLARAKKIQRAARVASSGVVKKCYAFHRLPRLVREIIGDARALMETPRAATIHPARNLSSWSRREEYFQSQAGA